MPPRIEHATNGGPEHPFALEPISMRVKDACRYTGISRSTLYLLIASSEVEIIKLGAATLVITDSLRNYVESKRASGSGRKQRNSR